MGLGRHSEVYRLATVNIQGAQRGPEARKAAFAAAVDLGIKAELDGLVLSELGDVTEGEVRSWKAELQARARDIRGLGQIFAATGARADVSCEGSTTGVAIVLLSDLPVTGAWFDTPVEGVHDGGRVVHLCLSGRGKVRGHIIGVYAPSGDSGPRRDRVVAVVKDRLKIATEGQVGDPTFMAGWGALAGDCNSVADPVRDRRSGLGLAYDNGGLAEVLVEAGWQDTFRKLHRVTAFTKDNIPERAARLDYVFLSPGRSIAAARCGIARGAGVWDASDHRAVVLEMSWRGMWGERRADSVARGATPRWVPKLDEPEFVRDWQHHLRSKEEQAAATLEAKLDTAERFTGEEELAVLHEQLDPLGKEFLADIRRSLEETWGATPKAGKRGVSVTQCNAFKSLSAIQGWRRATSLGAEIGITQAASECRRVGKLVGRLGWDSWDGSRQWIDAWARWAEKERDEEARAQMRDALVRRDEGFRAVRGGEKGLKRLIQKCTGTGRVRWDLEEALSQAGEDNEQWTRNRSLAGEAVRSCFESVWRVSGSLPPEVEMGLKGGRKFFRIKPGQQLGRVARLYLRKSQRVMSKGDILAPLDTATMKAAVAGGRKGAAPGLSGVGTGAIAHLTDRWVEILRRIVNLCLRFRIIPHSWKSGVVCPIPKGPGVITIHNCRPITLLEHCFKLVSGLIAGRLSAWLEEHHLLDDNQNGFRKGRTTGFCIASLLGAMELVRQGLVNEEELWLLFVDMEKAFDRVPLWALELSYRRMGFSEDLIDLLRDMDMDAHGFVALPWGLSEPFNLFTGVRQGDVLSPLKFILWMDSWLTWRRELDGGLRVDEKIFMGSAYADDLAEATVSRADMECRVQALGEFLEWNAMGAHASKSHLMVVRRKGAAQVAPVAPIRLTSWDFRGDRVREAEVIDVEDGEVRFLGLWVTRSLNWEPQLLRMERGIKAFLRTIGRRSLSGEQTQLLIDTVLAPRFNYHAPFVPVTGPRIRKWDTWISNRVLYADGITRTLTRACLYTDKGDMGCGLTWLRALGPAVTITEGLVVLNHDGVAGTIARKLFRGEGRAGLGRGFPTPVRGWCKHVHDALWELEVSIQNIDGEYRTGAAMAELRELVRVDCDNIPAAAEGVEGNEVMAFTDGSKIPGLPAVGWCVRVYARQGDERSLVYTHKAGCRSLGGWVVSNNVAEAMAIRWFVAFCLELSRRQGQGVQANVFSDSQVSLDRLHLIRDILPTRKWVRMDDAWLWRDVKELRQLLEEGEGGNLTSTHCFSHVGTRADGKGANQEEWITEANEGADIGAGEARDEYANVDLPAGKGQLCFMVVGPEGPWNSDPRRHALGSFRRQAAKKWSSLPCHGAVMALPGLHKGVMRGMLVGGVERLNSRREVRGFMLKLWTGTLPVPTQLHYRAGATSKWPLGQDGKAICPLCGEQEGNTTHAMALCGVEQMQTARDAAVTELDGLLEVRGIRHQRWQTGDLMGSQAERLNSTTTISLGGSFPRTWLAWWETLRLGGSGELDEGNRRSARVADPRVRQAPMGDLVAHLEALPNEWVLAPAWTRWAVEEAGVGGADASSPFSCWRAPAVRSLSGPLKGHFFIAMEEQMERCRAARDFVRAGKDGRRVTGWVWIPGRSEERRWRSSLAESPLARQLLRIPMSRFPVFKWRQWLAGSTSSREQGPTVGWMSLMVWDNAGARRARPIEEALSGLGQACKGELVGGVAGLKVKVRSSWLRLQDLCPLPRVHPQNWLRTPPAGHGPLPWRGAVDQRTWQDCLRGCRTDKKEQGRWGRLLGQILYRVWKVYAGLLASWKKAKGLDWKRPRGRGGIRGRGSATEGAILAAACLGVDCINARWAGTVSGTVADVARRRCARCRGKEDSTETHILASIPEAGLVLDWAAETAPPALVFLKFRAEARKVATTPAGSAVVSAGWRLYKRSRRRASIHTIQGLWRRTEPRLAAIGGQAPQARRPECPPPRQHDNNLWQRIRVCRWCGWSGFIGNKCKSCKAGTTDPILTCNGGVEWTREWRDVGVHTGEQLRNHVNKGKPCFSCGVLRPKKKSTNCPICASIPQGDSRRRGRWEPGRSRNGRRYGCTGCNASGQGYGRSCSNRFCDGRWTRRGLDSWLSCNDTAQAGPSSLEADICGADSSSAPSQLQSSEDPESEREGGSTVSDSNAPGSEVLTDTGSNFSDDSVAEDELAGKRLNRSHLRRGRGQPADSSVVSGHLLNEDASDDSLPSCQGRTEDAGIFSYLFDSDSDSSNLHVNEAVYSNTVYSSTDSLTSCPGRTGGRGEAWEAKGEG